MLFIDVSIYYHFYLIIFVFCNILQKTVRKKYEVMTIKIAIFKTDGANKEGLYPIKIIISKNFEGKQIKKRISTGYYSLEKDWNSKDSEPRKSHPKHSTFFTYILDLKAKIDLLKRDQEESFDVIIKKLFSKVNNNDAEIVSFGYKFAKTKNAKTQSLYETTLNEFSLIYPTIYYSDFNYSLIKSFREHLAKKGLKDSSIHSYLRKLRAIYNEFCKIHNKINIKPFESTFNGLATRSSVNKRNYLERKHLVKFSNAKLTGIKKTARDLWMLQFYLGGQDLIDVINLKKKDIYDNRAMFKRKKLSNGYYLENKIFKKARLIIDSLKNNDNEQEQLFNFRIDTKGYETLRRRIQRALIDAQDDLEIVLPNAGNIGIKTARHTFANFGKMLYIEPDLLRELMGHERNEIDTIYKDVYSKKVKDKAHSKILKYALKEKKKKTTLPKA